MNVLSIAAMLVLGACTPEPEISPFEGPDGVLEVVTDQEQVLVATTHLRVKNAPGPGRRFGDHADAVGNWLYETRPDGWLGAGFRNVGRLDWWTLTVWESEEAMRAFVASEPHLSAMRDIAEVSAGAEARSEWMAAEDAPPDWDHIVERLEADPQIVY
ncbi:MAG: DUF3291 domain-containing protein [Alphaproteobacteria bacterium]|nr:DUF3291 domain-containing protein [Alphaproteobacteria bacterium]